MRYLEFVHFSFVIPQKTTAHRRYIDDVPAQVKNDRLQQMIKVFRETAERVNRQFIGKTEIILIEDVSSQFFFFL